MALTKRKALPTFLLLLTGCTAGLSPAAPDPAWSASPSPAAVVAVETPAATVRPPEIPVNYDNIYADPGPRGEVSPAVPFPGTRATVRISEAPPRTTFEVWLTPSYHVFRFGLPHPRDYHGVKLGDATSDEAGQFSLSFEMKKDYASNNGTEQGKYRIWLVYPGGKVIAPGVAGWDAGLPTTFQGRVFDEYGKPYGSGARVRIKVTDRSFDPEQGVVYAERETAVVNGAYRFDHIPAPADTEIVVVLSNGLIRKRWDGHGGMQVKWGCCEGDYTANYGRPLTYNFGGPATPDDPLAPAYFVSPRMADENMAWTTLSGKVYDQAGNLVPDSVKAIVIVQGVQAADHQPFYQKVPVVGGSYRMRVPTGVVSLDLRVGDGVHVLIYPPGPRILFPEILTGKPSVANFGGPATPEDPEAPNFPFPSPRPAIEGPSPFIPTPSP